MYCRHCGKKIADDSVFCANCGKSVGEENRTRIKTVYQANQAVSEATKGSLFNRDMLLIYLERMQTMEFVVYRLNKNLQNLDYRINGLGKKRYIPEPDLTPPRPNWRAWEDIIWVILFGAGIAAAGFWLRKYIPWGIFTLAGVAGVLIAIICILIGLNEMLKPYSKAGSPVAEKLEYERKVEEDNKRVEKEISERDRLLKQRSKYAGALKEAGNLLAKGYNANIIPAPFRNMGAVHYLYEYISTSQASLESAMLHCDLQKIQSQLDIMIRQQQEIIIQNAQILAQNSKMIEQNDELIKRAIRTEKNTEYASQYAAISATNSEVIAFTNTVMAAHLLSQG